MKSAARILLVGCGHMGSAMLRRWLALGMVSHLHVVKPTPLPAEFQDLDTIGWTASLGGYDAKPDVIVFAVRPPLLDSVSPPYAKFKDSLFISIIAGRPLSQIENLLGPGKYSIIRAMPNIASAIGAGMTFGVGNSNVTLPQRQLAETLLRAIGDVAWMEDESGFDAATALSGCGPAYVFALTEAMTKAGKSLKLPESFAVQLARQTVIGSGAFMAQTTEAAVALRDGIGSPGSMSEAALQVLQQENGLDDLMLKAMQAACDQGRKLSRK